MVGAVVVGWLGPTLEDIEAEGSIDLEGDGKTDILMEWLIEADIDCDITDWDSEADGWTLCEVTNGGPAADDVCAIV